MTDRTSIHINRRMVLRGAAGFTLALPFLPSLVAKEAKAAPVTARPRLFWFGTDHGAAFDSNMFPPDAMLTNQATFIPGHLVTSGTLAASSSGTSASLSPILSASSATLTPKLVGKMNVLRGLDVPFYIAHNTGLHLGNYARNDNNGDDGTNVSKAGMRPTIDQIMANSASFYTSADLGSTKARSMVINPGRALSWAFSNPAQGVQSTVQNVQGTSSSLKLFNSIFNPSAAGPKTRAPIVDKVLANYNSLRQSNTRLSAADGMRLDTHIAMISQLQASLTASLACATPATPTDDASNHTALSKTDAAIEGQLWADVVAAAFACEASRIGVFGWGDTSRFSDYAGSNWHQDVAHQWFLPQQQGWLTQSYQGVFEQVFLYLAAKLDSLTDVDGRTVLDNTLMAWSQECCMSTHDSYSIPVVTFGSAGGYFNTGLYCDYRKIGETAAKIQPSTAYVPGYTTYLGVLYAQWLANVLQAMGVAPSEFELWTDSSGNVQKGYGTAYLTDDGWTPPYDQHYQSLSSPYFTGASGPLPFLKA
jgi:hypothetical protein